MEPPRNRRSFVTAFCILAASAACLFVAAPASGFAVNKFIAPSGAEPYPLVLSDITALDSQVLTDFMSNHVAGRYYSNGTWTNPDSSCWSCLDSAATAAAVLYRQGGETDPTLLNTAVQTYNNAITFEEQPTGFFRGNPSTSGPLTTEFLLVELGTTYFELHDRLSQTTKASWSSAVQRAADYLISSGQTSWYANGNIQLRLAEDMWLAWKITGFGRFDVAYEHEWTFAMSPPQTRWPGFGLHITKSPARADGSDGSAYLAESNGGTPGFDPMYTMTQLDTATSMWILSRDPRDLRLMNMLLNQLLPRVSSMWTLDATGGTRKDTVLPFYDVAPEVLFADGDRPDLALGATLQLWRLEVEFTNTGDYDNPNYYKGLSGWVSMLLLNNQWPNGIVASPALFGIAPRTALTPRVVIAPRTPAISTLSKPGLTVTVAGIPTGSTIRVTVSPVSEASSRAPRVDVIGSATGRVGRSDRLTLHVRSRNERWASQPNSAARLALRLTVSSHGYGRRSIIRLLELRAS